MTTEAEKALAEIVALADKLQADSPWRRSVYGFQIVSDARGVCDVSVCEIRTKGYTEADQIAIADYIEALQPRNARLIADGFTALKTERDRLHEADLRWGKLHQRVIDERAAEIRAREAAETALATAKARIAELEGANEKLAKQIRAASQWYWPEDDTSSEACRESVREVFEDAKPGEIGAYSCGGVVYTRYFGWLPPEDDADSDDDFEVDEATEAEAKAKMAAEIARRALSPDAGNATGGDDAVTR